MDLKIIFLAVLIIVDVVWIIIDFQKERKSMFLKTMMVFKVLVGIGLGTYGIKEYQETEKEKKISATFGVFGKQKDATRKDPLISLGSNASQDMAGGGVLKLGHGPVKPLSIYTANDQLLLDIKINDSRGDGIAILSGRTWKIVDTDGIDYNNDDYGFEIITNEGRVIFQIEVRTDTVICNGMFCLERGFCFFYTNKTSYMAGAIGPDKRFDLPDDFQIPPIFKYPRNEYLGVRLRRLNADYVNALMEAAPKR